MEVSNYLDDLEELVSIYLSEEERATDEMVRIAKRIEKLFK